MVGKLENHVNILKVIIHLMVVYEMSVNQMLL